MAVIVIIVIKVQQKRKYNIFEPQIKQINWLDTTYNISVMLPVQFKVHNVSLWFLKHFNFYL